MGQRTRVFPGHCYHQSQPHRSANQAPRWTPPGHVHGGMDTAIINHNVLLYILYLCTLYVPHFQWAGGARRLRHVSRSTTLQAITFTGSAAAGWDHLMVSKARVSCPIRTQTACPARAACSCCCCITCCTTTTWCGAVWPPPLRHFYVVPESGLVAGKSVPAHHLPVYYYNAYHVTRARTGARSTRTRTRTTRTRTPPSPWTTTPAYTCLHLSTHTTCLPDCITDYQ